MSYKFRTNTKYFVRLILLSLSLINVNCITTVSPGILFNSTKEHIYPPGSSTQLGPGRIIKKAEFCNYSFLIIDSFVYYGIPGNVSEAMTKEEITRIAVIDYTSFNILGPIFYKKCTIIWGE